MKITMEITRDTRLAWVKTANRIRHICHLRKTAMPQVAIKNTRGKKIGTIIY